MHGRLDHGGFFLKNDNGHNVLNKEFVRDYWLPIIRGQDAPREGIQPSRSPFVRRLSYLVKTAREIFLWIAILEIVGSFLIHLGLVVPGWCLVAIGGVIPVGWLWIGLTQASSPKPPKPSTSPILPFILILLMIVGGVWLAATVLHFPPSTPSPQNNYEYQYYPLDCSDYATASL